MSKVGKQEAIESLLLISVVLIISMAVIAALRVSSKTSTEAQTVENRIYWQSASPIEVTDAVAYRSAIPYSSTILLFLRNNGAHQIRITRLLSGRDCAENLAIGEAATQLSDPLYLSPGGEKMLNLTVVQPYSAVNVNFSNGSGIISRLGSASSLCDHSPYTRSVKTSLGTLTFDDFGFEYMEYIGGVPMEKKQLGEKPLSIRCSGS
ncbi:TPA: hypothetical protein HA243_00485 [Candidatus Micrarchaeota archaeon]|nr:hypothetical protein [Candidatus Micrarchaeota archaeon]